MNRLTARRQCADGKGARATAAFHCFPFYTYAAAGERDGLPEIELK